MNALLQISPRRVGILILKDIRQGSGNFLAVYAVIIPIVLTLLVNLVFGDLFSQTSRLGIVDPGASQVTMLLQEADHIRTTVYEDEAALRESVRRGVEEMGIVFPTNMDDTLTFGGDMDLSLLRWGEAPALSILTLESALVTAFAQASDVPQQVTVEPVQLGNGAAPWNERMLPLILIMAVTLGGLLIAATTLIEERQMGTLNAVTTTVTSLADVYLAKLVLGVVVGIGVGLITLWMNQAFGDQPGLLIGIMALGALAASVLGIMLGSVAKDMDTFMAIVKGLGIVLYAPGIVEMFPGIPEWVGRIFPTYYVMNPIIEVTQNGASWSGVSTDVAILAAIAGAMLLILAFQVEKQEKKIALAG